MDGRQFHPASPEERAAARRALGLDCERLCSMSGASRRKRIPLGLLDAWAAVDAKAREGALLALVGDGPEWDQVHARAQTPNLAGSVHLAGQRSDVATWYRAADLYVISSHIEGLSNTHDRGAGIRIAGNLHPCFGQLDTGRISSCRSCGGCRQY